MNDEVAVKVDKEAAKRHGVDCNEDELKIQVQKFFFKLVEWELVQL